MKEIKDYSTKEIEEILRVADWTSKTLEHSTIHPKSPTAKELHAALNPFRLSEKESIIRDALNMLRTVGRDSLSHDVAELADEALDAILAYHCHKGVSVMKRTFGQANRQYNFWMLIKTILITQKVTEIEVNDLADLYIKYPLGSESRNWVIGQLEEAS